MKVHEFRNYLPGPGKVLKSRTLGQKILEINNRSRKIAPATAARQYIINTVISLCCIKKLNPGCCSNKAKLSWKNIYCSWKGPGKVLEFC